MLCCYYNWPKGKCFCLSAQKRDAIQDKNTRKHVVLEGVVSNAKQKHNYIKLVING